MYPIKGDSDRFESVGEFIDNLSRGGGRLSLFITVINIRSYTQAVDLY